MTRSKREPTILPDRRLALPEHPFFYTTDQVASILQVSEVWLKRRSSYAGRSLRTGRGMLRVVNLAEPDEDPVWRINERELLRWLAFHGVNLKSMMSTKREPT